jgi:hypothetical protein
VASFKPWPALFPAKELSVPIELEPEWTSVSILASRRRKISCPAGIPNQYLPAQSRSLNRLLDNDGDDDDVIIIIIIIILII